MDFAARCNFTSFSREGIGDDEDVAGEKTKILFSQANDPVVISGLTKYFGTHKAVDDIYLSIPAGECFGLLGTFLFKSFVQLG